MLVLLALGGVIVAVPVSARSAEAPNTRTGRILGTVVDTSDDPIPGATVLLQGPSGDRFTAVTKDDGGFVFDPAPAGVAYQIAVTAEGFADWSSSITVEPGQDKTLTEVRLRILAVQRAVTVSYSEKEVAAQQLKAEEQQRVLGFIPNMYVVYEPHPEPLTTRMKFHMAYKDLTHPVFSIRTAAWAGVQQARNNPDEWRQGAEGYGKRLGAGFVDGVSGSLISNAILPSLLHQDPRYFYQGSGTKKSRALHAMLAPLVCKGDNGAWQPNYSQWGGSLIGYSISTAYYPSSDRTAGHVFQTFGIDMGLHVVGGLAQEFILSKFTSRGKH
ncbi:MAG TPA: carboxypeptidase-like regulatory domain-containing protein [Candidatus Eremiobacteraceae bacterium]|nr:carboxypeptidase-like regulatory domain-containing protein [Candidatus Eremiobacteraceae bacterium]